jgi:hypothetical protein
MCQRLILDVPRVRPILLGDPALEHLPGTGCARARAIAALSFARSVSPTIIIIGLALLVHSHRVVAPSAARTQGQSVESAGGSDSLSLLCPSTQDEARLRGLHARRRDSADLAGKWLL